MATFQKTREVLLYAISEKMVSDEELAFLYDINTSKNRDIEYQICNVFNLHKISEDDCVEKFRFQKNDIPRLVTALQLPDAIQCGMYSDLRASWVEALYVILKRLAFPSRYSDMVPRFVRPVPQLSMICNKTLHWLDSIWGLKLTDSNHQWLTPLNFMSFANSNYLKSAALDNIWGLVDSTLRDIAHPVQNQWVIYNGHKRKHGLKYQSITTPNDIIAYLLGPFEGRSHDSNMLVMSV